MKLIKPSFQIIEPTDYTMDDIYKSIELAGRVSHKSEDKITETSAKDFVGRMLNMKHLATCEFGTIYLYLKNDYGEADNIATKYSANPYSKVTTCCTFKSNPTEIYITTNYRVLVENNWLDDLKYLCEPTEYHEKRYTVKFILDRGILAEFTRHRRFSFMAESTRYCNYSKNKFNNELTFIIPNWLNLISSDNEIYINGDEDKYCYPEDVYTLNFLHTLKYAERAYLYLLTQWNEKIPDKRYKSGYKNNPWKPEQARGILPLFLKTELYMCGFAEDWKYFFKLRDDKQHAHPQAYELAHPLHKEFIKRGYINE